MTTPVFTPNRPPVVPAAVATDSTPVLVEATPAVTPPEAPTDPVFESTLILADPAPETRKRPRQFYQTCMWNIVGTDADGIIEATNTVTGDVYNGTIVDFNDMVKGF